MWQHGDLLFGSHSTRSEVFTRSKALVHCCAYVKKSGEVIQVYLNNNSRSRISHANFKVPKRKQLLQATVQASRDADAMTLQAEDDLLKGFLEFLGVGAQSPEDWNYSPEWWGTQGGEWGRNKGTRVFAGKSTAGNGLVEVTAHPASLQDDPDAPDGAPFQEWRVLRFQGETRQSVARVTVTPAANPGAPPAVRAHPECLAFEYMKTLVAAALGAVGCLPESSPLRASMEATPNPTASADPNQHNQPRPVARCRALCIGLGGGSLPMFLAHHFPALGVEAVELDPVVIAAATTAMGLSTERQGLSVAEGDAAEYVAAAAERVREGGDPLDLVFVDAFDGDNTVPEHLCSPGSPFLQDLAAALHPSHGTAVVNLHGGPDPLLDVGQWVLRMLAAGGTGTQGCGYDPAGEEGARVAATARAYRDAILPGTGGLCYTVSATRQQNIAVVVTRGAGLAGLQPAAAADALSEAARRLAAQAGVTFPAGGRACRGFSPVLD